VFTVHLWAFEAWAERAELADVAVLVLFIFRRVRVRPHHEPVNAPGVGGDLEIELRPPRKLSPIPSAVRVCFTLQWTEVFNIFLVPVRFIGQSHPTEVYLPSSYFNQIALTPV
jgi:hypothetical protein